MLPRLESSDAAQAGLSIDEHLHRSQLAQRRADKWLISGSLLIGTAALGVFGLPLFLWESGCCAGRNAKACPSGRCWSPCWAIS